MQGSLAALVVSLAIGFALVATRTAAFVFVSPFPGPSAPPTARVGLALALALAIAPSLGPSRFSTLGGGAVLATFAEAATGATIGLIFRIGMSAADVLGSTIAHALGLNMASTYDPSANGHVDPLTRITTRVAMGVALAVGAHRVVLGAVLASFRVAPPGAFLDVSAAAPAALLWAQASLDCGVRLAMPAVTVALTVQLALGLATRAAPALQAFGVSLPLTLASGVLVLAEGSGDSLAGIASHLGALADVVGHTLARAP